MRGGRLLLPVKRGRDSVVKGLSYARYLTSTDILKQLYRKGSLVVMPVFRDYGDANGKEGQLFFGVRRPSNRQEYRALD